ncbi:MAG TPA: stage II sporulation protein P [Peptococcaceae bacterium]|nr:stage II sporulation protein P [Peptococcaceae bacterium]
MALFIVLLFSSVTNDGSQHLVNLLSEKSFPFEMVLLEGAPGLSQPEREYMTTIRKNVAGLGLYLMTGVNISDARTYFLSFYAPPAGGIPWLGWAYHPNDPEMEGPILEPLTDPFYNEPAPATSEEDILLGVYHTHNAESYAGDGGVDRVKGGQKGEVMEVGELLVEALKQEGINAVHSPTIHDEIYDKSYDNSYQTAVQMLEENPTIRLLLDIHRDGIPTQVGKSTVIIDNKEVAKIMIVIGQKNPHWEKNNQIAQDLIKLAEEKYPGLFSTKIRYASEARYNQHLTNGALLLEIGSQLNTLEEAKGAVGPLAKVLKAYLEK